MTEQNTNNLFEKVSRKKLRFPTERGDLTTEQLWDLPLTSEGRLSLNGIGMGFQAAIREMGQDSLIDVGTDPNITEARLRLAVIKHVISVKQAENAATIERANKKQEREKLLELLARKQDNALEDMSVAQIQERLDSIA